jgi:hypothetical protein
LFVDVVRGMVSLAVLPPNPYLRLAGEYRGPMFFHDLGDNKDKQFDIDTRIVADETGTTWTTKYRFAPPRYGLEFLLGSASADGKQWTEQTLDEKLVFKLTNWAEFASGKADWFEIEKPMIRSNGIFDFRRRYTIKPNGDLWSEKWIRQQGKEWEFSHRMELKRIR